jgi:hypothetical protein
MPLTFSRCPSAALPLQIVRHRDLERIGADRDSLKLVEERPGQPLAIALQVQIAHEVLERLQIAYSLPHDVGQESQQVSVRNAARAFVQLAPVPVLKRRLDPLIVAKQDHGQKRSGARGACRGRGTVDDATFKIRLRRRRARHIGTESTSRRNCASRCASRFCRRVSKRVGFWPVSNGGPYRTNGPELE